MKLEVAVNQRLEKIWRDLGRRGVDRLDETCNAKADQYQAKVLELEAEIRTAESRR